MLKRIIIGFIGFGVSYILLKYRKQIYDFVGTLDFAERYLGRGSTISVIALLGIIVAVVSFMYMIGTLDNLLAGGAQYFGGWDEIKNNFLHGAVA